MKDTNQMDDDVVKLVDDKIAQADSFLSQKKYKHAYFAYTEAFRKATRKAYLVSLEEN